MKAFILSFDEHSWEEEAFKDQIAESVRRVRSPGWREATRREASCLKFEEAAVSSIEGFADMSRRQTAEAFGGKVLKIVKPVTASLKALLKTHDAKLVRAWAYGFEGNHNDTEFIVGLEPAANVAKRKRTPAKRAPAKRSSAKRSR